MPQNKKMIPSPAQQEAICFGEGTMLVLAGPGSGKTAVITQRIRYLVEERHIKPSDILTITFTKAAALEHFILFFFRSSDLLQNSKIIPL